MSAHHSSQRQEALSELLEGRLDVAFMPDLHEELLGVRSMDVLREPRLLLTPITHPYATRAVIGIEETNADTFVTIVDNDIRAVDWWLVSPRADGTQPIRGPEAGDFEDLLDLVATGHGLALSTADSRHDQPRDDLAWIPIEDVEDLVIGAFWRADERDPSVLAYLASVRAVTADADD